MTDAGIPMGLKPCPICNKQPKRNGRFRTGGVLCAGPLDGFPAHRVQTYGPTQEEADLAWNTRAVADTPPPAAAGDRSLAEGLVAMSADVENARVLKLHFDHEVTAADRAVIVEALNARRKALRTPEPNSGGEGQ